MTFEEIDAYIARIPKFTKKNSLAHTRTILKMLGNPQETFAVIHVAGSNGKGSVCSFLHQALCEAGYRVGMFSSPHLVTIRERFVCAEKMASKAELTDCFEIVMQAVKKAGEDGLLHPSYFEFLFLMAMVFFSKKNADYVVLETGLGGRLDATNAILHPRYTVITSISLEHTEILGDTIEAIAAEKAGIIKENVPIVYDATNAKAAAVIEEKAKEKHALSVAVKSTDVEIKKQSKEKITFFYGKGCDKIECTIPFPALYQAQNAAVALQVLLLCEKDHILTREQIVDGISHTKWPGRMEQVQPEVFLDGAHNVAGITRLLETVHQITKEPPLLLFSMVKEKNYEEAVRLLVEEEEWAGIFVTTISDARGICAKKLAEEFLKEKREVFCVENVKEAFRQALLKKKEGQLLICTGSLYLIGELKKELEDRT
ncbi:MAG: bifunctional folylpolyglutamate synthase/dihydrofolate synthase [Lachnospiraceae bacterium]